MKQFPPHHPDFPRHYGELILVRHGQSTANALGVAQGRADYPLSDKGLRQAELTGAHLARLGGIAAVYTSPLSRAAQTALAIAQPLKLTPIPVDDLVEADVGALSGLTWDQFKQAHPEAVAAYEAAEAAGPDPRHRERFLPGWEPSEQVVERIWNAIAKIASAHPEERVVVVAHGGVLNAFLTHLLEGDARAIAWKYHHKNCAVTRLVLASNGPRAACLVDVSHLEGRKVARRRAKAVDSPTL